MASFTDAITQFNPYVSQLPVEAMVKVGMQKQAQYEEGYKKIQAQIDQVAGLDILKDVDKQYLQSKLDELGNNLKSVAAGDFSNFQLVNSVGGMTKQVAKDKNVQNAVASTNFIRNQQKLMSDDRKKGTLHANNEIFFNDRLNEYMSSKEVGETFGTSYQPYTDYKKKWRDVLKELDVKEDISDLPFLQDSQGRYIDAKGNLLPPGAKPIPNDYMIRETFKGKDPEKVKQAIMSAMDDNDYKQMHIDAYVKYKSYTPDMLYQDAKDRFDQNEEKLTKTIESLVLLRNQNVGDKNMVDSIDKQLDQYRKRLNSDTAEFEESAKEAYLNPEGFRSKMYIMDSVNSFANSFSNISHIQEIVDSPIRKQMNEDRKYNFDVIQFQTKNEQWIKDYKLSTRKQDFEENKESFNQALEAYKAGFGPNPFVTTDKRIIGGSATDKAVLDGLLEGFTQGASFEQNKKDRTALKNEWAANQISKSTYAKSIGKDVDKVTDAEYRSFLDKQWNLDLAKYNQNPNSKDILPTMKNVFSKYSRLDKLYKLKVNVINDVNQEVVDKNPEYKAQVENLSKNKVNFVQWKPSRFASGRVNPRGETSVVLSKSEAEIYDDIQRGDAKLYVDAGQILLSYPKSNINYSIPRYGTSYIGSDKTRPLLLGLSEKFKTLNQLEKKKDNDYISTLGNRINTIPPAYDNLPKGSAGKFLPILQMFKDQQKGQTEEAPGFVVGKDFDWDKAVALANDKETTPTFTTGMGKTYVTLTGKIGGKDASQRFVVSNNDFSTAFPGVLGKEDVEFIQAAAANNSTNYKYSSLLDAMQDPSDAFGTAGYTNYNTKKYIVKGDIFFDKTDNTKSATVPVIYVKSKKTGNIIPITSPTYSGFTGSEKSINDINDLFIDNYLKNNNINANF